MYLKDLPPPLGRRRRRRSSTTRPQTSGLPRRSVWKLSSAVQSVASSRTTVHSSSSTYRSTKPMKTLPSVFTVACVSHPRCLWADIFTSCTRSKKRRGPRRWRWQRPGRRSGNLSQIDQRVSSRWTTRYWSGMNPNSHQTCSAAGWRAAKLQALEQTPQLLFSEKHLHSSEKCEDQFFSPWSNNCSCVQRCCSQGPKLIPIVQYI